MKRYIRTYEQLPLGDYNTRSYENSLYSYNSNYWYNRIQQTKDQEEIEYFAHSPNDRDRQFVALNPYISKDLLEYLCHDSNEYVRRNAQEQLDAWAATGEPHRHQPPTFYSEERDYHNRYMLSEDGKSMIYVPLHPQVDEFDDEFDSAENAPEEIFNEALESGFAEIALSIEDKLGLYLDRSSVRGDEGTIFIYSDPYHENDADMWIGDDDAEIVRIDYSDYVTGVVSNVLTEDTSKWRKLYRTYLKNLIS